MKIVISSGHGLHIRGASGYIDEVDEARRVVDYVAAELQKYGIDVKTYHDNISTSQNENLHRIVDYHNAQVRDLDVSVHFNAYQTTDKPMGTECLYVTQPELAAVVSSEIAVVSGLLDRGAKERSDLYFLNNTAAPAILIEVAFVDSVADVEIYQTHFETICEAIAAVISDNGFDEDDDDELLTTTLLPIRYQQTITDIASASWIASYSWQDRGIAPVGWTQGMALAFAQACLKLKAGHPALIEITKPCTDSDKDALNLYREDFDDLGLSNENTAIETLRHLFALMLGHGMRESSGQYCCGRDQSAENTDASTCEAGAFQTSYNAHSASDPWFYDLMDEYLAGKSPGYKDAFAEGVTCSDEDWENYGEGRGAEFQALCKSAPTFAAETAALTLRNLANHYGPIIRHEVELMYEADVMFEQIQNYLDASGRMS